MSTTFFRFVLVFTLGTLVVNALTLLNTNILVEQGGSYIQRVIDSDLVISKCTIKYKDSSGNEVVIELDLDSTEAIFPEDFVDTTNLKDRLHSIGSGMCGCKLDEVSTEDPTGWTMGISGITTESAAFTVGIYEPITLNSVEETSLGSSLHMTCGNTLSSPTYCHMYNPRGELVYRGTSCSYSTAASAAEDLGTWSCIVGATPYINPVKFTVDVTNKDKEKAEQWLDETNDQVVFGCRIKDCCTKTPTHCIMTSPGGEKILIRPGSASVRYSSIHTNLKENICAIEIKKPLLDSEKGPWTCEINDRGLFIQVDKTTGIRDNTFSASTVTELGKPFQVGCKLPYSTSYCFVTSPSGERYNPTVASRAELGECSYSVTSAEAEHNGTWICSYFKEDDVVAIEETFEVFVRNALKCSLEVSASRGGDATMFCNTGRAPLEYCWFSSPAGKTYQVKEGVKTAEVSYVGNGLGSGDCGITVHDAQNEHLGNWTCTMKIGTTEKVYTITLDLSSTTVSLATGLGAGIGVSVVVLALIGGVLHMMYRNRRKRKNAAEQPQEREAAEQSDADV